MKVVTQVPFSGHSNLQSRKKQHLQITPPNNTPNATSPYFASKSASNAFTSMGQAQIGMGKKVKFTGGKENLLKSADKEAENLAREAGGCAGAVAGAATGGVISAHLLGLDGGYAMAAGTFIGEKAGKILAGPAYKASKSAARKVRNFFDNI